jgi:hypothetical protein
MPHIRKAKTMETQDEQAALPRLGEVWRRTAETAREEEATRETLSLDTISVGQELGPVSYVLDAETVARYAKVMGVETPLFPTVVGRQTAMLRDTVYRVDHTGINAKMEMELFRPEIVGETLTVSGVIVAAYEKRGKSYIVTLAETKDADGNVVERLRKAEMRGAGPVIEKWDFIRPTP